MKKVLVSVITSVALLALCFGSAMAARPSYPQRDKIATGLARHHIIPWEELVSFGRANFKTRSEQQNLINSIINISTANLGGYTSQTLAQGIFMNDREAIETWESLLAWLPGNLVIGPENRENDPGNVFDRTAFVCLKSVDSNVTYTDTFVSWQNPSATIEHKKMYILKMAQRTSAQAPTSPCWAN
ncbi:MAG: hypothetical protein NTY70_20185 [Burkholderiales bacterium]|nr:hypothetical protein [Burkholderiales bacterium]